MNFSEIAPHGPLAVGSMFALKETLVFVLWLAGRLGWVELGNTKMELTKVDAQATHLIVPKFPNII